MERQMVTVRIALGNDAMQTPSDVARLLDRLAQKVLTVPHEMGWDSAVSLFHADRGTLLDDNGNTVGLWDISEPTDACPCGHELDNSECLAEMEV